jgi:glycosyltransferase involved in cell wall biosynthesis
LASLLRNAALSVRKALRYMLREAANAWATWRVALRSRRIVVCTREEARRLRSLADPTPVEVIPHFVEPQPTLPSAQAAKQRLGLEGKRVVGVLGFIHRRKGHDRVVNALPHLPDDTVAVFIGRAGRKDTGFARRLQAQAAALGVADRLRITGFVPEDALRDYLAATDVAACPFRSASASGSLSTWIAAERPIVASRLPLFEEYNTYASGALHLVDAAQPRTLADALAASLNASGAPPRAAASEAAAQARARLRSRLSLSTIAARHVALYRRVAAR